MSSSHAVGLPHRHSVSEDGTVVPFFVCSGLREARLDFTVYPYGGTFDELVECPAREICAWHAAHDIGGEMEFSDQPEDRLLPVAFQTAPFSCPHFSDHQAMLRTQRRLARKAAAAEPDRGKFVAARRPSVEELPSLPARVAEHL